MSTPLIQAKIEGNEIVIRVPIDGLVWVIENDPEYTYKVIDREKLAKEVVFEINEGISLCDR